MTTERHAKLVKRAAIASVVVASVLLLSKVVVWFMSDSTSVLSSMLDSMMDIVASVVNFFAVRYALIPADEDHPFGHSKAEGIAALLQATFILGSVVMLLMHVLERLLNPQALTAIPESIGVMVFSTVLTMLLVMYQRWVYKQTQSLAIKADSEHYTSDILTNFAVVVALLGAWAGVIWLDPLIAFLVALVLLKSVHSIVTLALTVLMDQSMDEEDEQELIGLITAQSGVFGVHDLKTRQAGSVRFIQFHLELDGQQPLYEAHAIGDQVEAVLRQRFANTEIIIHHDPV